MMMGKCLISVALHRCTIEVDGENETLDILDTAGMISGPCYCLYALILGQEQFAALQNHWIREAQAFLLVYAVNDENSFNHLSELYNIMLQVKARQEERFDFVLVGNKSHLPQNERKVTYEMGKQLADEWSCPFVECSAKSGDNIQLAFELVVREMKTDKPVPVPKSTSDASCCVVL